MNEIIKALLEKKIPLTLTIIFIIFVFAPIYVLIYIWNRSMFSEMDIIKLTILSAGIGMIFIFINWMISFTLDATFESFTEKNLFFDKEQIEKNPDKDFVVRTMAYYLFAAILATPEILVLMSSKLSDPSMTLKNVLESSLWIISGYIIIISVAKFIGNCVRMYRNKKKTRKH